MLDFQLSYQVLWNGHQQFIWLGAVWWLIVIYRTQNKSLCLRNVSAQKHTRIYLFRECKYILYTLFNILNLNFKININIK